MAITHISATRRKFLRDEEGKGAFDDVEGGLREVDVYVALNDPVLRPGYNRNHRRRKQTKEGQSEIARFVSSWYKQLTSQIVQAVHSYKTSQNFE